MGSLYDDLGVTRDATRAEIKAAGKKKRVEHHPDRGGDVEAFHRASHALAVLINPADRAEYDRTGTVRAKGPIEDDRAALALVNAALVKMLNDFVASGFAPAKDPRRLDVPKVIAQQLVAEIAQGEESILVGDRHITFLKDFAARLKIKKKKRSQDQDLLQVALTRDMESCEEKVENIKEAIRINKIALALIENYDFKKEETPEFFTAPASWVVT